MLASDSQVVVPTDGAAILGDRELAQVGDEMVVNRPVPDIGGRARILVRSVGQAGGDEEFVLLAGSTAPIRRAQHRLEVVLGVAGPAMVIAVATMAWFLTGAALRPVSRMTRRAATISLRDPQARLPQPPGRDEVAELGQALNVMLDRIVDTVAHERALRG